MKRILAAAVLAAVCMGTVWAGEAAPRGQAVPYQVAPIEAYASVVKNWSDDSMPQYSIMKNVGEWELAFQPTATMGNQKPFHPGPEVFKKFYLVAISRVSKAPAPGQQVLKVKSVSVIDGELVLSYVFMPPENNATHKAKNTILVAIPNEFQNPLRISEDIETDTTRATNAELEEAIREGRVKPGTALPLQQPRQ